MFTIALRRLRIAVVVGRLFPVYALLGLLEHLVPLRQLARSTWRHPIARRDRKNERRLAASVSQLSKLVGDRDCLQRSLLLYHIMSRAGADPMLFIGFDQTNGRLLGHAWVTIDGRPIIEPEDEVLRFSPVFSFGARGALLAVQPNAQREEQGRPWVA
jgi:Transglutaminase-like superfamily